MHCSLSRLENSLSNNLTINNIGGSYDNAKRENGQEFKGLKRVRVRDHHRRDYELYLRFGEMAKRYPVKMVNDEVGYTPIQCYVLMDSHGDRDGPYPCVDYDTLDRVLCGKENLNLQISMWTESVLEGTAFVDEIKEWTKDYPQWVFKSFLNQLHREVVKKIGFVPTFMKV